MDKPEWPRCRDCNKKDDYQFVSGVSSAVIGICGGCGNESLIYDRESFVLSGDRVEEEV